MFLGDYLDYSAVKSYTMFFGDSKNRLEAVTLQAP